MKTYKNSAELKGLAKTHMFGNYSPAVGAYVIMSLVLSAVTLFGTFGLPSNTLGSILEIIFYLVYFMLVGIFTAGETYLYLNISCGQKPRADYIFYGFTHSTAKILTVQALILGMYLTYSAPLIICAVIYLVTKADVLYIFMGVAGVIALVGIVVTALRFMPVYYLLHDFPNMSEKEILQMSSRLMKGQMGRLFYLYVSFIPVQLLGLVSFGIGNLWVMPYRNATFTEFFMNLMKPDIN